MIKALTLLAFTAALFAQNPPQAITPTTATPSGACTGNQGRLVGPGGTIYTCQNGTWAQASGSGGLPSGTGPVCVTSGVGSVCNSITVPGAVTSGSGSGEAGVIDLTQGTLPTLGVTAISLIAPSSVTSYGLLLPGNAPAANQFLSFSAPSSGVSTGVFTSLVRAIGYTFDGGGSALSSGVTKYLTVPFGCTIQAWNITVDAGTATIKVWKIATGTAIPTVSNSINTSGVAIASGTAIHSTTLTDFTTTAVAANDIFGFNLFAVSGATQVNFILGCA